MSRRRKERVVLSDEDEPASEPRQSQQPSLAALLSRIPLRPAIAPPSDLPAEADIDGGAAAHGASGSQLWCDKHAPSSVDELVVAKKKLEAIRGWLAHQQALGSGVRPGRCLVLTGPAGAGKSTAARLVAHDAGFDVTEWNAPMPTLWDERGGGGGAQDNGGGGTYQSKMDAFESWLDRARTMAPLSLSLAAVSLNPIEQICEDGDDDALLPPAALPRPKLLLLEDIPLTAGIDGTAKQRIVAALTSLATTSRFPSIVCLTDSTASELGDYNTVGLRELISALERCSAAVIAINPATRAELQKLIARVAASEGVSLAQEDATSMAEAARGDVRAALGTLQMHCAGVRKRHLPPPAAKRRRTAAKSASAAPLSVSRQGQTAVWERSETMSVFHALGKVLYNKRVHIPPPTPAETGGLLPQHVRLPMEVASPEAVLAQAGLSASAALAFLHENAPDFVDPDAIADYADVAALFSHAAVLLCPSLRGSSGAAARGITPASEIDDLSTGARAAVAVASRGYMFSNAHPAANTFRQIRGPVAPGVERDGADQGRIVARRVAAAISGHDSYAGGSVSIAVSQTLPFVRVIATASPELVWCLPQRRAVGGESMGSAGRAHGDSIPVEIDRARGQTVGAAGTGRLGNTMMGPVQLEEEEDPIEDPD